MGRQVRFRLTDDEIDLLGAHLLDVGAAFIPWRSDSADLRVQPELRDPPGTNGEPWVMRSEDVANARRYFVEMQGYWLLDWASAPAIDFSRGPRFEDVGTRPGGNPDHGRLHFATDRVVNGEIVPWDSEFVSWADAALGWVRRTFSHDAALGLYLGPPKRKR